MIYIKILVKVFCAAALACAMVFPAKAQEMKVALNTGYAPFHFIGPSGAIVGYNIDLLDEVSKRIGRPYKIFDVEFASLIAGLNSGVYDFSGAVVQVTPERAKSVLFTEPYLGVDLAFLVQKKDLDKLSKLEDLRGKSIAVNRGSLYDQWLTQREAQYGWTINRYSKMTDAVQAVTSGRDFAHIAVEGSLRYVSQQNTRVAIGLTLPTGGEYALMFGLGQRQLRDEVEMAIECMKTDGALAKIHEKWMGVKPAADALTYKPLPGIGAPGVDGYDAAPHELKCSK